MWTLVNGFYPDEPEPEPLGLGDDVKIAAATLADLLDRMLGSIITNKA